MSFFNWMMDKDAEYVEKFVCEDETDGADVLLEKWSKDVNVKHTGENAGKSVAQLKSEIENLKGKAGNKEKMGKLLFALRAKGHWKKGEGAAKLPKED
jgi:hypothetical protein